MFPLREVSGFVCKEVLHSNKGMCESHQDKLNWQYPAYGLNLGEIKRITNHCFR